MVDKPIRLRSLAAADVEDAVDYYRDNAGHAIALDFVDAVQAALRVIKDGPGVGSLRFSYELGIPNLRAWPIERFDHAVFYIETDTIVDVWRVLHTRRDIPRTLRDPDA